MRRLAHRVGNTARKVAASVRSARVLLLPARPSPSSEAASGLFLMFSAALGWALATRWLIVALLHHLGHRLVVWSL
jgi:hypothetical protein